MECETFPEQTSFNWLIQLKYGVLIGLKAFSSDFATISSDFSPKSYEDRKNWSRAIVMQICEQILCERPELSTKESCDSERAHITHAVAILKVTRILYFYRHKTDSKRSNICK